MYSDATIMHIKINKSIIARRIFVDLRFPLSIQAGTWFAWQLASPPIARPIGS